MVFQYIWAIFCRGTDERYWRKDLNQLSKQNKLWENYKMQATMIAFIILFFSLDANKSEDDLSYISIIREIIFF